MTRTSIRQLKHALNGLVGTTCWGVAAGGCTGSRFNLDFGEKRKLPVESKNVRLPLIVRKYQGEFGLQVGCAAWRLDTRRKSITSSTDLCSPDGPLVAGLERLRGCVVTSVQLSEPGLDVTIEFDRKYWLRIFCDQFDSDCDNYTVSREQLYIGVEGRLRVSVKDYAGPGELGSPTAKE